MSVVDSAAELMKLSFNTLPDFPPQRSRHATRSTFPACLSVQTVVSSTLAEGLPPTPRLEGASVAGGEFRIASAEKLSYSKQRTAELEFFR